MKLENNKMNNKRSNNKIDGRVHLRLGIRVGNHIQHKVGYMGYKGVHPNKYDIMVVEKWIENWCRRFSIMVSSEMLNPKVRDTFLNELSDDVDVLRWLDDYEYYMDVFNNKRHIHSILCGFITYRFQMFRDDLTKYIQRGDENNLPPQLEKVLDWCCDFTDEFGDDKWEKMLENQKWFDWDTNLKRYELTPYEKSLINSLKDEIQTLVP